MLEQFFSRDSTDQVLEGLDFTGKTIIITGANIGMGYESAKAFAKKGAHVVMACRDEHKALAAMETIKKEVPGASLAFQKIDMADFKSIKAFSDAFPHESIDIFLANAGVIVDSYKTTAQGYEITAGVNHFGHFYLTQLLLPKLLKAKESRVVFTSSDAHKSTKELDFNKWPQSKKDFGIESSYAKSKLANAIFATELNRRYQSQGLTANSCHPGLVATNIGNGSIIRFLMVLARPVAKSANQGAGALVYCASRPSAEVAGRYFSGTVENQPSKLVKDLQLAKGLWEYSESEIAKHTN